MLRAKFCAIFSIALALTSFAQQAEAHAKLVSSSPAAEATVAAPHEIVLTFSEAVRVLQTKLADPQSKAMVDLPAPKVEGADVHYALAKPLSPGRYEMTYRVITPDAHVAGGTLVFTVSP